MARWKPIESAPLDATLVLVAGNHPNDCWWVSEAYFDESCGGWFLANTHHTDAYGSQIWPTRWQPKPAPPTH